MGELSVYLPGLLLAYGAVLLGLASPGPNILAVIGVSMSVGRVSGLALATGVAAGSFCWAVLTVVGLSALLATYAAALTVIKIVGGLYLLWLAYKAFRSAASRQDVQTRAPAGSPRTSFGFFTRGLVVQMTNPKAALTWIAIVSLGMQNAAPLWVGAAIVIGATAISLSVHWLYALAFSTPRMVRAYARARRVIEATLGAFFAFAGLKLLTSRA